MYHGRHYTLLMNIYIYTVLHFPVFTLVRQNFIRVLRIQFEWNVVDNKIIDGLPFVGPFVISSSCGSEVLGKFWVEGIDIA